MTESAELIQKVREIVQEYKDSQRIACQGLGLPFDPTQYDEALSALDRLSALTIETACNLDRCLGDSPTGQGIEAELEIVHKIRAYVLREIVDGMPEVAFWLTDERAASLLSSLRPAPVKEVPMEMLREAAIDWIHHNIRANTDDDLIEIAARYGYTVTEKGA
jgi:hypothetical protein